MRNFMAADCAYYRFGAHVAENDERAGEERKPHVHGDEAENVIKRQQSQLFEIALVMLFHKRALFDYSVAVHDLRVQIFGFIPANLDVLAGSRRHYEKFVAELVRLARVFGQIERKRVYRFHRKRFFIA